MTAANKFSLLIVEDDKDVRTILGDILSPLAATVHDAEDGEKGLQLIMKNDYDCVVSDINMPVLSGLELLKEVRYAMKAVPFILVTGYGDQNTMREALKLGAADFIDKPFDNKAIREAVRKSIAYGAMLKEVDLKIEEFFAKSNLPAAEILKFKEIQRGVWRMRALNSVYHKAG